MAGESYLMGWLIYLAGALGFLLLSWYLSRGFPALLRWPLRAALAALVLLPWPSGPEHRELAPAWIVTTFDSLFGEASPWRAGGPLLMVVALAAIAGLAEYWRSTRRQGND